MYHFPSVGSLAENFAKEKYVGELAMKLLKIDPICNNSIVP